MNLHYLAKNAQKEITRTHNMEMLLECNIIVTCEWLCGVNGWYRKQQLVTAKTAKTVSLGRGKPKAQPSINNNNSIISAGKNGPL